MESVQQVQQVRQETRDHRREDAKRVPSRVVAWRDPLWYASWAVPLLVYLLFPNRDYTADALIYAGQIESITSLFGPPDHWLNPFAISPPYFAVLLETWHPHHILLNPFGFVLLQIVRVFGINRILGPMATANSLAGALSCGFLYLLLRQVGAERRVALTAAWLLAFSFGWWFYAIILEAYAIPLLLLLIALYLLFRHDLQQQVSLGLLVALSLLSGVAGLFHETHVFAVPVIGYLLLTRCRARPLQVLGYLVSTGIIIGSGYLVGAAASGHLGSLAAFRLWLTEYTQWGPWGKGLALSRLRDVGIGTARVFWAFPRFLVLSNEPGWSSRLLAWMLLALFGGAGLALVLLTWRRWRTQSPDQVALLRGMALLTLLYGGFALWWNPGDVEFILPLQLPFWIAVAFLLIQPAFFGERNGRATGVVAVLLLAIFTNNFAGRIYPSSRLANNHILYNAGQMVRYVQDTDLVILDTLSWDPAIRYFYRTTRVGFHGVKRLSPLATEEREERLRILREGIDTAWREGRRVFTQEYDSYYAYHEGIYRTAFGARRPAEVDVFYAPYLLCPSFRLRDTEGSFWVYQVLPKGQECPTPQER
ncbi:MAG: glycosyltransferase family 39 protein [Anaerolineae bacterium]|nr:glycosyltransferase family 39 protein [Anaerolineae bacterium]